MTHGLTWRADYAGRPNAAKTALGVTGFVTLTNSTGTTFDNAAVRVVAGNVNRLARPVARRAQVSSMKMGAATDRRETTVSDVDVISLGKNLSLRPNQTKQSLYLKRSIFPSTRNIVWETVALPITGPIDRWYGISQLSGLSSKTTEIWDWSVYCQQAFYAFTLKKTMRRCFSAKFHCRTPRAVRPSD
jgi:hypothetical protein